MESYGLTGQQMYLIACGHTSSCFCQSCQKAFGNKVPQWYLDKQKQREEHKQVANDLARLLKDEPDLRAKLQVAIFENPLDLADALKAQDVKGQQHGRS